MHIEEKGIIRGHPSWSPDLLIESQGGQPVVVEAKRHENSGENVAERVESRLDELLETSGEKIEAGISLVYPRNLRAEDVKSATFSYAVHQIDADGNVVRWPLHQREFKTGNLLELADVIETVTLSLRLISHSERLLRDSIADASYYLLSKSKGTSLGQELANVLHQEPSEQTIRMAVAILVNAFVFHYAIEGTDSRVPKLSETRTESGMSSPRTVNVWRRILQLNYWPVFSIARDLLQCIPEQFAEELLERVVDSAERLKRIGTTTFHDLSGRMFQQLITDRKFLATFYTLPSSAVLLAEMAVARLQVDWTKRESIAKLRIADFACGTGMLLSAVQRSINRLYRRAGGDDSEIHKVLMEEVLLGTEIMPSSAHLAASILSSAHPGIPYKNSLVYALPFGSDTSVPQPVSLGSLELLESATGYSLFGALEVDRIGEQQMVGIREEGRSEDKAPDVRVDHHAYDLVIMNPPFTRLVNPHKSKRVKMPAFAAFETTREEQQLMSERLINMDRIFGKGTGGHVAYLGTFLDLADRKLRDGGILALILPFVFINGKSWEHAREMLLATYHNVMVISIAASGKNDSAFSADTSIAECMILATRGTSSSSTVRFVNLPSRPQGILEAIATSHSILQSKQAYVEGKANLGLAGIQDPELVHAMCELQNGKLALPRQSESTSIPMTTLEVVAERGVSETSIHDTTPSAPFDLHSMDTEESVTYPSYPALWWHHAKASDRDRERRFVVPIDAYCTVRSGMQEKASDIWGRTAHRMHANRDFGFAAQSLAMCLTPEPSLGAELGPTSNLSEMST